MLPLISVIGGVSIIAELLSGEMIASYAFWLALVSSSLPSLLALFLLLAPYTMKSMLKKRRNIPTEDKDGLRRRLSGLSQQVMIKMGSPRDIGFGLGFQSAAVYTKKGRKSSVIFVGDRFLRGATDEEVEGILAHELGHIKQGNLRRVMSLIASEFLVVQMILIFIPFAFIVFGTLFAMTRLLALPINWKREYEADLQAAETVGTELLIMGLKRLAKASYVGVSLTHPPLSRRIARLHSA